MPKIEKMKEQTKKKLNVPCQSLLPCALLLAQILVEIKHAVAVLFPDNT